MDKRRERFEPMMETIGFFLCVSAAITFSLIVLFCIRARRERLNRKLLAHGISVQWRVFSVELTQEDVWDVVFFYSFEGAKHRVTQRVNGEFPGNLNGMKVEVLVDPSRPERAQIRKLIGQTRLFPEEGSTVSLDNCGIEDDSQK